jgi:dTDP-4-dehydrorhamnose reductase
MPRKKILVLGADGQLGKKIRIIPRDESHHEFIFLSKSELPIDQTDSLFHFFKKTNPFYCINCAAYTAVDKAEQEKEKAFLINGESVGNLASICAAQGTRLIHFSTDYVFDGTSLDPLKEEDRTSPINIYGESKLLGEQLAMRHNPDTVIFRTSWLYSEFGNNFVRTMIRLMGEKESINVVNDQIGSPTYAGDLARLVLDMVKEDKFFPGLYHFSDEGKISWFEFALAIRDLIRSSCRVNPISSSQYPTLAKRPAFSLLDKTKIKTVYSIRIPDWKSSLVTCMGRLAL